VDELLILKMLFHDHSNTRNSKYSSSNLTRFDFEHTVACSSIVKQRPRIKELIKHLLLSNDSAKKHVSTQKDNIDITEVVFATRSVTRCC
jgi:hypothetical protein